MRTNEEARESSALECVVNGLAQRPLRFLTRGLLVIVGAEAISCTEIAALSRRGHAAGRVSVDVAVDLPVDRAADIYHQYC
jgi:hypothetical protein